MNRPLAALSSSLLARKGQAKPAMRPQGFGAFGRPQEDLGWNDMGYDAPAPVVTPPSAPTPAPVDQPAVVRQQEELAAQFTPAPRPARNTPRTSKAARIADGRKAAFTLRLDAERHLRLRLATALKHKSAQALVTEAVDALLSGMPELNEMAARAQKRS